MALKQAFRRVAPQSVRDARDRQVAAKIDRNLAPVISRQDLDRYRQELGASGLLAHLERARDEHRRVVSGSTRGQAYGFGAITGDARRRLYAVVRARKPKVGVETGVCNGVSTAVTLQALNGNVDGHLHSIDYPEPAGATTDHWEGKGGAVIPPGRESGWVIPDELRDRWTLHLGRSQDLLVPLLEQLGRIDYFFHDGEHSYEAMTFEYEHAWEHLTPGGVLASDDTLDNTAWSDFARRVGGEPMSLGGGIGVLVA